MVERSTQKASPGSESGVKDAAQKGMINSGIEPLTLRYTIQLGY